MAGLGATSGQTRSPPLELWGGVECSVVRIGDSWRDQVRETGHHHRAGDLERIAALGIRTLRYPLLWERVTIGHPTACGWEWHDARVAAMDRLDLQVIGGLMHHGSGPPMTNLLDERLPELLAAHAREAAERYPSIVTWTPINEPLTTARISCLYGLWYPHRRDEDAFLRAVVIQCRAVQCAMRAIRSLHPKAKLLQTEDIGRVFATPQLRAQAEYENERRWLSLDLLCGVVDRSHPWRRRLEQAGAVPRHLDDLATGEAAPDLIGVNHYLTTDRFLDHRETLYPPHLRNGRYADTEAARVDLPEALTGWKPRLREVWERYRRPMAITEVHLGCRDRQDQVRWLMQAWDAARALRAEGARIEAVTVWAMFGLMDWDSMLCNRRGRYESGVFDAEAGPPRLTLLADAVRALAHHGHFEDPLLQQPGWWQREDRVHAGLRGA